MMNELISQGEIKKYLEINNNEYTITHNLWDTVKSVLTVKFIAREDRKISNKQLNPVPKGTGGTTTNKAQMSRGKDQDQSKIK